MATVKQVVQGMQYSLATESSEYVTTNFDQVEHVIAHNMQDPEEEEDNLDDGDLLDMSMDCGMHLGYNGVIPPLPTPRPEMLEIAIQINNPNLPPLTPEDFTAPIPEEPKPRWNFSNYKDKQKQIKAQQKENGHKLNEIRAQKAQLNKIKQEEENRDPPPDLAPVYNEPPRPGTVKECTRQVIIDMITNSTLHARRHIFSNYSREAAYVIYCQSPTNLHCARSIFPFPSESTLSRHFSGYVEAMFQNMTNIDKFEEMLCLLKYPAPDGFPDSTYRVAVAIDAMSVKLWTTHDAQGNIVGLRDIFVSYCMQLDNDLPSFAFNIIPHYNGVSAGVLDSLIYTLQRTNATFQVCYAITDGDRGYDQFHTEFFSRWIGEKSFEEMVNRTQELIATRGYIIFVTDILHFLKNRRSAIVTGKTKIYTAHDFRYSHVQLANIKACTDLGDIVEDTSELGKMQDMYPIGLFSMKTVLKLWEAGNFVEMMYVLPNALWIEATRNEHLDVESRLQMLRIAFKILMRYFHHQQNYRQSHPGAAVPKFFCNMPALIRALNSILALYTELKNNSKLNFSHMTTMSLEHYFGMVRSHCRGDDRITHICKVCAKANLCLRICKNLGIDTHKQRRDFQGGVTMDTNKHVLNLKLADEQLEDSFISLLFTLVGWPFPFADSAYTECMNAWHKYFKALATWSAKIRIPRLLEISRRGKNIHGNIIEEEKKAKVIQAAIASGDTNIKINRNPFLFSE